MGHQNVDLKHRLPVIYPAKVGLFGISEWLQFGTCNHGKPHVSLTEHGEENSFKEGKRKLEGRSEQRVHWRNWDFWSTVAFYELNCNSLLQVEFLLGKRRTFFFYTLGSAVSIEHERSSFWSPNYFNWGFCFYTYISIFIFSSLIIELYFIHHLSSDKILNILFNGTRSWSSALVITIFIW